MWGNLAVRGYELWGHLVAKCFFRLWGVVDVGVFGHVGVFNTEWFCGCGAFSSKGFGG